MLGSHKDWVPNASEALAPKLREIGYSCLLTSNKLNRYLRFLDIIWTIIKHHKKFPIMCLQVFGGSSFIVEDVASRVGKLFGMKIIMVLRGGALPDFFDEHPKWTKKVLSRANKIVCPSAFLANTIKKIDFSAIIIPNAINIKNYPLRIIRSVRPNLLWMRTFHEIYNPQMAIDVIEHLVKDFPEATLTMAGQEKGLLDDLIIAVKLKKLEENVRFVGFLDLQGKQSEFSKCDVFLNTNRIDNMPTSVVEAAAFGIPIVATSVGGVPFLIEHGHNGILVPNEDTLAMTNAVKLLIENPKIATNLSKNARLLAESHDWSVVLSKWDSLFKEQY